MFDKNRALYRGKRVDNGEWVVGYYCFIGYTNQEKRYIIPTCASVFYGFEVIPETIGQYTGLTDNSGTDAFENDVLMYNDNFGRSVYGVIKYGEIPHNVDRMQHVGFYINWVNDGAAEYRRWWRCDLKFWIACPVVKVIGNTFDDPGLLGVE